MQFLADENIPLLSVKLLRSAGIDITCVSEISPGISDLEVLNISENQNRLLLTFDLDFGEMIFKDKIKVTKGIVLFRLIPSSPLEIGNILLSLIKSDAVKLPGYLTVVERDFIRQRPLH
jgi:predicted nuclease of predicted toxin-antitoxin system